jgi:flavin-binding protein dodecin
MEVGIMANHVYKQVELTGSSSDGIEAAARTAIERAGKTLHNLRWFEITNVRGIVDRNATLLWQVTLKAGFTLDD